MKAKAKYRFLLNAGSYTERFRKAGSKKSIAKRYKKGDKIWSDRPLDTLFKNKFTRIFAADGSIKESVTETVETMKPVKQPDGTWNLVHSGSGMAINSVPLTQKEAYAMISKDIPEGEEEVEQIPPTPPVIEADEEEEEEELEPIRKEPPTEEEKADAAKKQADEEQRLADEEAEESEEEEEKPPKPKKKPAARRRTRRKKKAKKD